MVKPSIAFLLVMLAACSASPPLGDATSKPRAPAQTDMLCIDDCMGSGGTREFCEDRCTN